MIVRRSASGCFLTRRFLFVLFVFLPGFLFGNVTSSRLGSYTAPSPCKWKIPMTNIRSCRSSTTLLLSHRHRHQPQQQVLKRNFPRGGSKGSKREAATVQSTSISTSGPMTLNIPQRLLAGGTSRGVAQFLLYPMDALRTLSQTRDGRTLADVGANALVRGCATTSSFAMLIGSIQFAIFGATRDTVGPVVASALGAAGSCLVSIPQEVIKQRLVTGVYSSFRNAVATIWTTEGITGFYSGWQPTVTRNVPFVVITFTSMDLLKRYRLKYKTKQQQQEDKGNGSTLKAPTLSVQDNLLIGIGSSLIGATCTHPADVIKTRMMTQAASKAIPYSSTIDCIQTILKTEGISPFYSGFLQRSLYMGPLWSIQFALNGKLTDTLKDRNSRKAPASSL